MIPPNKNPPVLHKCFGCGVEKDLGCLEVYPYPEDHRLCEEPLEPLFVLECQPGGPGFGEGEWRAVVVCHECFRKLDPDMWISENCWKNINPVIPFDELPLNNIDGDGKWKPENYHVATPVNLR